MTRFLDVYSDVQDSTKCFRKQGKSLLKGHSSYLQGQKHEIIFTEDEVLLKRADYLH